MRLSDLALAAIALAGCQQQEVEASIEVGRAELVIPEPDLGTNPTFREALSSAPGHELIVTDLLLGPDAVGSPHYHPWEEYLYVLGGSAILDIEGEESRTVLPGETAIIAREKVHTPIAGPDGIRAMVIRVHDEGDQETISAEPALAE